MGIEEAGIRTEKFGEDHFLLIFGTFFGSVALGGFFGISLLNTNVVLAYSILGIFVGVPALIIFVAVLLVLFSL